MIPSSVSQKLSAWHPEDIRRKYAVQDALDFLPKAGKAALVAQIESGQSLDEIAGDIVLFLSYCRVGSPSRI